MMDSMAIKVGRNDLADAALAAYGTRMAIKFDGALVAHGLSAITLTT
jgi:hypothetical protein